MLLRYCLAMRDLHAELRQDRNGKSVTRWVKRLVGRGEHTDLPAPTTPDTWERHKSVMDQLESRLPTRRDGLDKSLDFVCKLAAPEAFRATNDVERFLLNMSEGTLRQITDFIDDKENGFIVRGMCAFMIAGMAQRYRLRSSDHGIDYTKLHNVMLLGEDFQRSTPENFLDDARNSLSFNSVRDLTVRFENLMSQIKPQNLTKTPDFGTLPEKDQRRARAALVIANVYYTGADNGKRHRESELLECVERHFDRRFEVGAILDRIMDASPSVIDENMEVRVASIQEGWL